MLVYDFLSSLGDKSVTVDECHGDFILQDSAINLLDIFEDSENKVVKVKDCGSYLWILCK